VQALLHTQGDSQHTCAGAGLCCCTVAELGLAFMLDGCRSRVPFCNPLGTALVLGLKDRVCIVLRHSQIVTIITSRTALCTVELRPMAGSQTWSKPQLLSKSVDVTFKVVTMV